MAKELVKKGRRTVVVDNPKQVKKTSPEKTEKIKQPTEKPAAGLEKELLDERLLAAMKTLRENGITEFTSTLLRDKLALDKESGRGKIRRVMKRLAKDGKVVISQKSNTGKRKQYVYKLAK
jgi:hypothetical protein